MVGDNIDKNIQPQDMRLDNQTKSLHYFHVYAVRDRIDLSDYDDTLPSPDISSISIDKLLPSDDDNTNLRANYSILIARVLKKYMPFFNAFGNGLERHIRHQYYEEMSSKSEVVRVLSCCSYTFRGNALGPPPSNKNILLYIAKICKYQDL